MPSPAVRLLEGPSTDRLATETALDAIGQPLPFDARQLVAPDAALAVAAAPDGRPIAGIGVHRRAAAGAAFLQVCRASRVRPTADPASAVALASALRTLVSADARTVRLEVQLFHREPAVRRVQAEALAAAGFERSGDPSDYQHTIAVDLQRDEEAILASFDRSARRNVRALEKMPLALRSVDEAALVPRLHALFAETFARTGATPVFPDFVAMMRQAREAPQLAHFVGLWRADDPSADGLLAFAFGVHHGDRAEYSHGASTRDTGQRIPLVYPLLWELMTWARRHGATWFDMGGVTMGTAADGDDPLGGISDFKRFFSRDVVQPTEEWVLHGTSLVARAARIVQRLRAR
jgi:hypothetical protein